MASASQNWLGNLKGVPILRLEERTPARIERLAQDRHLVVFNAIGAAGGMVIGRVVMQQTAKCFPLAGQAASAALIFSALKYVYEQHIRTCMAMCEQLKLPAPTPVDAP